MCYCSIAQKDPLTFKQSIGFGNICSSKKSGFNVLYVRIYVMTKYCNRKENSYHVYSGTNEHI